MCPVVTVSAKCLQLNVFYLLNKVSVSLCCPCESVKSCAFCLGMLLTNRSGSQSLQALSFINRSLCCYTWVSAAHFHMGELQMKSFSKQLGQKFVCSRGKTFDGAKWRTQWNDLSVLRKVIGFYCWNCFKCISQPGNIKDIVSPETLD